MAKQKTSSEMTSRVMAIGIIVIIVIAGLITLFSYKEKYFSCILADFQLCISSKKYVSASGNFSFRYPKDFPLTFKTGNEMVEQYSFDDKYVEWVNFSSEFYPNAGGDRLGSIIVEKNSNYQSVNQYADEIIGDFNKLPERLKGVPPKIEYIKIGEENAVHITRSQQPSSFDPPSDDYVLVRNGELYKIDFDHNDYYHKEPLDYYEKTDALILSTFTFN